MVTKTLTITKEAYDRLAANKRESESFSKVIERLIPQNHDVWKHLTGILSEKEAQSMLSDIKEMRENNARIRHKRSN